MRKQSEGLSHLPTKHCPSRCGVSLPLSITSLIPGAILSSPEIQAMKADMGLNSIWKDFILAVKS